MKIRYFKGMAVDDSQEVVPEETQVLATYLKAYFAADGALERSELYDAGALVKVEYVHSHNQVDILKAHLQQYPGTPFAIRRTLATVRGYVWNYYSAFDRSGTVTGYAKTLIDGAQQQWLEIELDTDRRVLMITKYYWDDDHELRYIFEYQADGAYCGGFDMLSGDHASLEEIRDTLPDPQFYDNGYNLPQALAGTAIPPDP